MGKNIRQYTLEEVLFKKVSNALDITLLDIILILLIIMLGMGLRYNLFYFQSQDYIQNLQKWFDTIKNNGGIFGIGTMVGNYTPPYTYFLALLTYLPFSSLTSIKLLSVGFDLMLAVVVAFIVYEIKRNKTCSIIAFSAVFLLPTVIVNSAVWAQCDSIIAFFIMSSLYLFLRNKPRAGCFSFGLAVAIKIQSIFLAPLLLFLWLDKKLKFKHLLLIPLAYLISVIPTALAGGSYWDALTLVYWQVTTTANDLSFNCANFWAPVRSLTAPNIARAGTLFTLAVTFLSAYMIAVKKAILTKEKMILIALFYLLLIPFFLPHMHERYFFYAEIAAVIYACIRVDRFYIPVSLCFASLMSYLPFLFEIEPFSLNVLAIINLGVLCIIAWDLYRQ